MLGSHEDAEEGLAEVFVKVWRAAGSFKGTAKFTTWLYRIAGNTAKDMLRSRRTRPEIAIEDEILTETDLVGVAAVDPEDALIMAYEISKIDMAMQKLSEEDRLIVSLYHIEECSLEEIAEITGVNRGNLKVKLFRARQKLRTHLEYLERETGNELQTGTAESIGIQPGSAEPA
jgi:RNA polymerase sigma-70 factor (ECF subfamily)